MLFVLPLCGCINLADFIKSKTREYLVHLKCPGVVLLK